MRIIDKMSNNSIPQNPQLFLDELGEDFDVSLSNLCLGNDTNGALIRDLNQVISTLSDSVKVESIEREDIATDFTDSRVIQRTPLTPESLHSNDSCGSYSSTDSDIKIGKTFKNQFVKQSKKRLCFQGLSSEELSPISSVSSSYETRLSSDSQGSQPQMSAKNVPNTYDLSWRRYSKTDAPSVNDNVSTVQIGRTVKLEPENRPFKYVLGAATACGVKIGAMTMTYLNQGQSYELRLKKISHIPNYEGENLKTVLRLGFVEKRLQYRENEEMANWCKLHSKDRILDVDFALSYGVFDVCVESTKINSFNFVWNPNREASIFIKVNCISTEFTSKRHGGERGAPLRLIVDTYSQTTNAKFDCASCLVKVFKSKGADRKHKTDRDRIAKQPDSSLYFQPSYDCTLLTTYNEDETLSRSISSNVIKDSPSPKITSSRSHSASDSSPSSVILNVATSSTSNSCHSPQSTIPFDDLLMSSTQTRNVLPLDATSAQTLEWLIKNRFNRLTEVLSDYTSNDLRLLSREDLIQICGLSDGIRLFNSIHSIESTTRLTLFITTDRKVHHAIYLKALTVDELRERLIEGLAINGINLKNLYLIGPNNIKIRLTNSVIQNMKNESVYNCSFDKDEESYDLVLQLAF